MLRRMNRPVSRLTRSALATARAWLVVSTLTVVAMSARAGSDRLGVVDLTYVFKNFDETRQADATLGRQRELYRAYVVEREGELRELRQRLTDLQASRVTDVLLSPEARDARQAKIRGLQVDIQAKERDLRAFTNEKMTELMQQYEQERRRILDEINGAVRRVAVSADYAVVLDRSGRDEQRLPQVLASRPADDLTERVLEELSRRDIHHVTDDLDHPDSGHP